MRQPSPPPTPEAPVPAQAPVSTPAPATPATEVAFPTAGLPRNAQEVQGLRARREILRDQLERATNRRDELAGQLNRGVDSEARAGIQQRLKLIDDRILQIERDQATTERLLSSAAPSILAETSEPERDYSGMMDEDEAAGLAFTMFGVGIVLTLIVGRVRRRFARRRAPVQPAAATIADDPRVERLTQAVDAIAFEVERIGEGQRFVTQLLANRRDAADLTVELERLPAGERGR